MDVALFDRSCPPSGTCFLFGRSDLTLLIFLFPFLFLSLLPADLFRLLPYYEYYRPDLSEGGMVWTVRVVRTSVRNTMKTCNLHTGKPTAVPGPCFFLAKAYFTALSGDTVTNPLFSVLRSSVHHTAHHCPSLPITLVSAGRLCSRVCHSCAPRAQRSIMIQFFSHALHPSRSVLVWLCLDFIVFSYV